MAFEHPFYFLRHGETTWNAAAQVQGQMNSPLSEKGKTQALAAGEALKSEPIERIIASPLDRAFHTAQAVAAHHDIEIEPDPELMECHLGDWQDTPRGPHLKDYFRGECDPPNGETYVQFRERVWAAMQRAVAGGPNTLIVAHGGLWIAARDYVAVDPDLKRMPNALPLRVTPSPDRWVHEVIGGIAVQPFSEAY